MSSSSSSSISNLDNDPTMLKDEEGGDPKKVETSNENKDDSSEHEQKTSATNKEEEEEEDDKEGSCPLCLFLKAGGCREQVISWEKCVKGAETEEDLNKCIEIQRKLEECMDANPSYYKPLLDVIYSLGKSEEEQQYNEQSVGEEDRR